MKWKKHQLVFQNFGNATLRNAIVGFLTTFYSVTCLLMQLMKKTCTAVILRISIMYTYCLCVALEIINRN